MQGRALPIQLEELKNKASDEYLKADANYERAKLDLQNLKRKKTGKEAAKDIKARIKTFLDKDRLIEKKRADFNQFLKEIGVVVEVNIPKKKTRSRKYENEINFGVGIGMYEAETNKYIGLDQRADDAFVLGMDAKEYVETEFGDSVIQKGPKENVTVKTYTNDKVTPWKDDIEWFINSHLQRHEQKNPKLPIKRYASFQDVKDVDVARINKNKSLETIRDNILKVASIIQDDNYKMPKFIYLPQKDSDE